MTLSVRTRFEVFKRDRFTCSYCGRTPPAVLLEVDHIVPQAAGGSDDPENLTTSCADCNRGKADRLLEEGRAPIVRSESVDELEERLAQLTAYAELNQQLRALTDKTVFMVGDAWAKAFGYHVEERSGGSVMVLDDPYGRFPRDQSVRTILARLPLQIVLEAVDITASWSHEGPSERACRYFYGVCWRRIRAIGGQE